MTSELTLDADQVSGISTWNKEYQFIPNYHYCFIIAFNQVSDMLGILLRNGKEWHFLSEMELKLLFVKFSSFPTSLNVY